MARAIEAPPNQVRVVFGIDEATGFLQGREPVPDYGGDDPLNRAIQEIYDSMNDAFPDAGEFVEIRAEPAPWAGTDHDWQAANFFFQPDEVERVGHDADALADWIAEYTPDLLFALEDEEGRPLTVAEARRRVGGPARTGPRAGR